MWKSLHCQKYRHQVFANMSTGTTPITGATRAPQWGLGSTQISVYDKYPAVAFQYFVPTIRAQRSASICQTQSCQQLWNWQTWTLTDQHPFDCHRCASLIWPQRAAQNTVHLEMFTYLVVCTAICYCLFWAVCVLWLAEAFTATHTLGNTANHRLFTPSYLICIHVYLGKAEYISQSKFACIMPNCWRAS